MKYEQCVICLQKIRKPNVLLRFHVRYDPPIVILACKYCNFVEWQLRHYKRVFDLKREYAVCNYLAKFGIIYS